MQPIDFIRPTVTLFKDIEPGCGQWEKWAIGQLDKVSMDRKRMRMPVMSRLLSPQQGTFVYVKSTPTAAWMRIWGGLSWLGVVGPNYPLFTTLNSLIPAVRKPLTPDTGWVPEVQHVSSYYAGKSGEYTRRHWLVICRFCQRVAQLTWDETGKLNDKGALVVSGEYVSHDKESYVTRSYTQGDAGSEVRSTVTHSLVSQSDANPYGWITGECTIHPGPMPADAPVYNPPVMKPDVSGPPGVLISADGINGTWWSSVEAYNAAAAAYTVAAASAYAAYRAAADAYNSALLAYAEKSKAAARALIRAIGDEFALRVVDPVEVMPDPPQMTSGEASKALVMVPRYRTSLSGVDFEGAVPASLVVNAADRSTAQFYGYSFKFSSMVLRVSSLPTFAYSRVAKAFTRVDDTPLARAHLSRGTSLPLEFGASAPLLLPVALYEVAGSRQSSVNSLLTRKYVEVDPGSGEGTDAAAKAAYDAAYAASMARAKLVYDGLVEEAKMRATLARQAADPAAKPPDDPNTQYNQVLDLYLVSAMGRYSAEQSNAVREAELASAAVYAQAAADRESFTQFGYVMGAICNTINGGAYETLMWALYQTVFSTTSGVAYRKTEHRHGDWTQYVI